MSSRLDPPPIPRRDFLGLAGMWSAGLAVFGSIAGLMRLPRPSVLPESGNRFRIGYADEYKPGTTRRLVDKKVVVIARQEGVAAISLVCTHLGCIVKSDAEGFSCPCHGSLFDSDGQIKGGPAPRGLRWLAVSQGIDGRLVVDGGREVDSGTWFEV